MPVIEATCSMDSPIGCLRLRAVERGLTAIDIGVEKQQPSGEQWGFLETCMRQLAEYFDGKRRTFADVPLAVRGTAFQLDVWDALQRVGYGETVSYGTLGASIGCASGQAIGQALTRNPLPIIVPCHRVIAADGALGGFACGAAVKQWLLTHEQRC